MKDNQNLCYICDSDAAIYFTGTSEQCSQHLQEQAEMFTFLPQVMILSEEKYVTMFCCDIDYVIETSDLSQVIRIDPESE